MGNQADGYSASERALRRLISSTYESLTTENVVRSNERKSSNLCLVVTCSGFLVHFHFLPHILRQSRHTCSENSIALLKFASPLIYYSPYRRSFSPFPPSLLSSHPPHIHTAFLHRTKSLQQTLSFFIKSMSDGDNTKSKPTKGGNAWTEHEFVSWLELSSL
jgi:hypothetical protein